MKKSLIISDKDKYPSSPAATLEGKPKDRQTAPSITLTGKQVDAFCGCSLKVGDTGTATFHYVVKAVSAGDQYGDAVPSGKSEDQRLVLSLTHVESEGEGEDDEEEAGEDPEEEKDESPEEEAADEKDEPAGEAKDTVSPDDAKLEG